MRAADISDISDFVYSVLLLLYCDVVILKSEIIMYF